MDPLTRFCPRCFGFCSSGLSSSVVIPLNFVLLSPSWVLAILTKSLPRIVAWLSFSSFFSRTVKLWTSFPLSLLNYLQFLPLKEESANRFLLECSLQFPLRVCRLSTGYILLGVSNFPARGKFRVGVQAVEHNEFQEPMCLQAHGKLKPKERNSKRSNSLAKSHIMINSIGCPALNF